MSNKIRISVDGQHGIIAARSTGIRLVEAGSDLALTRFGDQNRDGRPGTNAVQATRGAPAGFLAVELSESRYVPHGIHVHVVRFESMQEPPTSVEIPTGRDVLFTAIGGDGEPGRAGGDGQNGIDGLDGAPATRESDATTGTDGGKGGDAGRGTDGADGGDGGDIRLYVDEENTHLLLASHHDTSGGRGGAPGSHGQPGRGGRGGNGGGGHKWRELVGYKFSCTSNCVGMTNPSTTTSLVRAGTRVGRSTTALMAPIRAQAVQGGNLQAMIAQVAARYGAMRHQRADPGQCRCAGGQGNCIGCASTPIYKDFSRVGARDGHDGQPGAKIMDPLFDGMPGQAGNMNIVVRSRDGQEQEYASRYNIELVDFDIEDENGDGIFEPGEHIIIRRIRVRNTGGMPSPTCPIPISVDPTDWFVPLTSDHGHTFIPGSIEAESTVTLKGSIKVLIRRNGSAPVTGTRFSEQSILSIKATMPWLNRELPHFDFRRTVIIQYPIELRQFENLTTLAQGSRSKFTWEVYNWSNRELGLSTSSTRSIEINVSFSADYGSLLSASNTWEETVVQELPAIPALGASPLQQTLRILPDAQSYLHAPLRIELYISYPGQEHLEDDDAPIEICLVQRHELRIQISSHHAFNPGSSVLVVTNTDTTKSQVEALRNFIENDINLNMDEWNVGLYGGLQYRPDEGELRLSSVLTTYQGKTVIFLGNRFSFFESGSRSMADLCDARALADATLNGTTCLFLGILGDKTYVDLIDDLVFPVPCETSRMAQHITAATHFFTERALRNSIQQEKVIGSPKFDLYTVPIKARWYRFGVANSRAEAKRFSNYMLKNLPQERFLVTPIKINVASENLDSGVFLANGQGESKGLPNKKTKLLAILHGNSHQLSIVSIGEPPKIVAHSTRNTLSAFERYIVAASLPVSQRVDIAWEQSTTVSSNEETITFALNAIIISLLRDINLEIRNFLNNPARPSQIPKSQDIEVSQKYLRLHFPALGRLLLCCNAIGEIKPPRGILEILNYAEASCLPQKKRHIARAVLMPVGQRRTQLRKFLGRVIDALLTRKNFTAEEIQEFHSQARAIHSKIRSSERNTRDVIVRRASKFSRESEHKFQNGQKCAMDLTTTFCTNEQWNSRFVAIERRMAQMNADTEKAWKDVGSMILAS